MSDRIDKRNNMLKALTGSSWGQDKETLLMTYNTMGKSIANYAAPVWSTNASDSSFKKIQTAQNVALRTAIGTHKMASIDHLYAFCAVPCKLSGGGQRQSWHYNSRAKPMKETLHSRHHQLFFLDLAQTGWKSTRICTHMP